MADAPRRFSWRGLFERVGRGLLRLPRPLALLLPLLWMGLIWNLSSRTFDAPAGGFGMWEYVANLAHAPLFGLLALFWCAALVRGASAAGTLPPLGARHAGGVLALVAVYALLDEWHQSHTPGRDPSAGDVATDLVGAACVLWIVATLGARRDESVLRRRLLLCVGACLGITALGVALRRLA